MHEFLKLVSFVTIGLFLISLIAGIFHSLFWSSNTKTLRWIYILVIVTIVIITFTVILSDLTKP